MHLPRAAVRPLCVIVSVLLSSVALAGPAQAKAASPSALAKAALVKGAHKVDKYTARHAALPGDQLGGRLLRSKAPRAVRTTYATVAGSRPGYCATAAPGAGATKVWVHDSWLNRTWRTTTAQAAQAGGACGALAQQADPSYGRDEQKVAVNDAYAVADAIDDYYSQDEVDFLPSVVDAVFLAGQGVTLTQGSVVTGYQVYDPENDIYRFCVVRDSGAWASYDDDAGDIVGKGTTGAACTY